MLYVFLELGSTPSVKKPILSAFFVGSTGAALVGAAAEGAAEGDAGTEAAGLAGAAEDGAAEGETEGEAEGEVPVVLVEHANNAKIRTSARRTEMTLFMVYPPNLIFAGT
jgi:hypothetical protein